MKNTLISDIHFYLDRIIEVSNVEKSELESVMSSINKDIKDANLTELIALKCYVRDKYTILSDEINSNKNTDTTDTENATDVTNDISEPINNEDAEKEINEKSDVIEAGRDLINRIENGIGQVLELEQISKLINIKIDISDKIEEIEQSDGENDDYLVNELKELLNNKEQEAINILVSIDNDNNESNIDNVDKTPTNETTENETINETTENKTVNESVVEESSEEPSNEIKELPKENSDVDDTKEPTPSDLDSIKIDDEEDDTLDDESNTTMEKIDDIVDRNEEPMTEEEVNIMEKINNILDVIEDQDCDIEDKEKITDSVNDIKNIINDEDVDNDTDNNVNDEVDNTQTEENIEINKEENSDDVNKSSLNDEDLLELKDDDEKNTVESSEINLTSTDTTDEDEKLKNDLKV